ncbi:MAG: ATP-binding protein [Bacteroidota bacterium]
MKKGGPLFVAFIFWCCQTYGQQQKIDSIEKNRPVDQQINLSKIQLQQQLMLSRKNQLELTRQEQQRILVEKQKEQLAEKEKQLLELQIRSKQNELEQDRKTQAQVLLNNQVQARLNAAIKDKQISNQQAALRYNKKWTVFFVIGFVIVAFFAVIVFLSQRKAKRLNAVISSQHAELEQMGMVKDTILGVVSHDMRTPVNTLLAFSELINEEDIGKDKLSEYLGQINQTLNHTSSMMNNLLNWSASQMQGFKTVIEPVDAGIIASNMIASFASRASEKKVTIINEIAQQTIVLADANMLDLIFRNLVSNALKFTPAGGSVFIEASVQALYTILSVTDTGVGMPEENRSQFNSTILSSTKSTLGTEREKGTGLGLLLCKTFTRLMNGQISVQKNKEKGCKFELVLAGEKIVWS